MVNDYEQILEEKRKNVEPLADELRQLNYEFEEYRQQRRKVEKEIKVELDEASFRAQTCEVNLKECKKNTTKIAELADESHLFEKSLQQDLTEKFQTQIRE